ncbi:MAG: PHP domain-containing protein [Coriobacteriaceae bacterium]|nr:PHP domain-containing protein [Coriobacteriaceae bacterium]
MNIRGALVADLHTHSSCSDGALSVEEMFELVCDSPLHAFAITDHDTGEGARIGSGLFAGTNITFVPGIELSTVYGDRDVHLLGYFFDVDYQPLMELCEAHRERRAKRACEIADRMAEDGYEVSGQMLRDSGETVNRTLLARALVKTGAAKSVDDAYARLISRNSKYYVDSHPMETLEGLQMLLEADAYPFIAHPAHYHDEDLIPDLVKEGLVGLEAYHSMQTKEQSKALVQLADDLGIAVSGGSDWHGDDTHNSYLGKAGLSSKELVSFMQACGRS